jgi:hypothetical protein
VVLPIYHSQALEEPPTFVFPLHTFWKEVNQFQKQMFKCLEDMKRIEIMANVLDTYRSAPHFGMFNFSICQFPYKYLANQQLL